MPTTHNSPEFSSPEFMGSLGANRTTNNPRSGLNTASICYGEYFNLSIMSIKGAQTPAASEQEH